MQSYFYICAHSYEWNINACCHHCLAIFQSFSPALNMSDELAGKFKRTLPWRMNSLTFHPVPGHSRACEAHLQSGLAQHLEQTVSDQQKKSN